MPRAACWLVMALLAAVTASAPLSFVEELKGAVEVDDWHGASATLQLLSTELQLPVLQQRAVQLATRLRDVEPSPSPALLLRLAEFVFFVQTKCNSGEEQGPRTVPTAAQSLSLGLALLADVRAASGHVGKVQAQLQALQPIVQRLQQSTSSPTTCPSWDQAGLPPTRPMDRRSNLSLAEFITEYATPGVPVVITDYKHRLTQTNWSSEELLRRCGHSTFSVKRREQAGRLKWAGLLEIGDVQLQRFLEMLGGWGHSARRPAAHSDLYIHDESLARRCPNLLVDFTVPKYFANDFLQRLPRSGYFKYRDAWPSLFVGPKGSQSALHQDSFMSHFFMYVIEGRKQWRLLTHSDASRVPEYRKRLDNRVDVLCPNVARDGDVLLQLTPYDTVMHPGDMIFVPSGSFHQVLNLDDSLAISMNYFDETNLAAVTDATSPSSPGDPDLHGPFHAAIVAGDWDKTLDLDLGDLPFLDEFKDAYFSRLMTQHPHFTADG